MELISVMNTPPAGAVLKVDLQRNVGFWVAPGPGKCEVRSSQINDGSQPGKAQTRQRKEDGPKASSPYFTKAEAAAYLHLGLRSFERLMARGEVFGARAGGRRLLFRPVDLDRYVERQLNVAAR